MWRSLNLSHAHEVVLVFSFVQGVAHIILDWVDGQGDIRWEVAAAW
jgi:hypothetical protein